ncbi:MAG: hypothetical protein QXU82_02930 [Candidatus Aenigmatarchaeota archaeon]
MINVAHVREFGETGVFYADPTLKEREDFLYGSFFVKDGNLFFQLNDCLADDFDVRDILPKRIPNAIAVVREWSYGRRDPMALVRVLEKSRIAKPLYVAPERRWGKLRLRPFSLDAPVVFEVDMSEYEGVIILSEGYRLSEGNRAIADYCPAVP